MNLEIQATPLTVELAANALQLQTLFDLITIEIEEQGVTTEFHAEPIELSITAKAIGVVVSEPEVLLVIAAEQGPPGIAGASEGQTAIYTYGETLSALVPVVVIDGQAFRADSANAAHRGRVCGITTSAATSGNTGTVRFLGALSDASWNWTGPLLFIGPSGTLVETPPSGFSQAIARIESANRIFVNPHPLYERA